MVAWAGSALHQERRVAQALACYPGLRGSGQAHHNLTGCVLLALVHAWETEAPRALAVLRSHRWSPGVPLSAQPPQAGPDPSPLCRAFLSPGAWVQSAALTCLGFGQGASGASLSLPTVSMSEDGAGEGTLEEDTQQKDEQDSELRPGRRGVGTRGTEVSFRI